MEKQRSVNKRYPLGGQPSSSSGSEQVLEKQHGFKVLGGISLYNQNYSRHLQKPKQQNNKALPLIKPHLPSTNTDILDFEGEYHEEQQILSFMNRDREDKYKQTHNIAQQIQKIIGNLKTAHFTTDTLIHEIQQHQNHDEFHTLGNFEDLIQFYNQNNQQSFTRLLVRIFKELKRKMHQQIIQIKQKYEENKLKIKGTTQDKETQTCARNMEKDVMQLKSQLKKKDMEYKVLYDFKKTKLSKKDTFISDMYLEEKHQYIQKLQQENKVKTLEIKKLKKQVDSVQDKFFCKLIQNQRKESLLLKTDLENILEDEYFKSGRIRPTKKVRNNIVQRKNGGSHLISRLSLDHKELAETFMGLIASAFDVNAKPKSMKEIPFQFSDFQSQLSFEGRRSSKKSMQRKSVKKFIQQYQLKDRVKKSSLRKQNEVRMQKNQSVKMITSEKEIKIKRSNVSMQKQSHKLKFEELSNSRVISETSARREHSVNEKSKSNSKRNKIKGDNLSNSSKKYLKSETEEDLTSKFSSFKALKGDKIEKKKLKKGVSFHLDELIARSFLTVSNQIDFCFDPTHNQYQVGPPPQKKTNYNSKQIVPEESQKLIDSGSRRKGQKGKLVKTKMREKKHFKIISCLQDLIREKKQSKEEKQERSPIVKEDSICKITQNRLSFNQHLKRDKDNGRSLQRATYSYKRSEDNAQNRAITKLAMTLKNKELFYCKVKELHKSCGQQCQHIKKYLEMFDKVKGRSMRPTVKLNCQNINRHINSSSSTLIRVRSQTAQQQIRV